jgi:hypothetical protein
MKKTSLKQHLTRYGCPKAPGAPEKKRPSSESSTEVDDCDSDSDSCDSDSCDESDDESG